MTIDIIPLRVPVSKKKKVTLNLNTYRNLCYHANNNLKAIFTDIIKRDCNFTGNLSAPPFEFVYTIFRRNNLRSDVMNWGAVIDKFMCDALVKLKHITDDNTDIIKKVTVIDGGVDKLNPHAKLEIKHYETV